MSEIDYRGVTFTLSDKEGLPSWFVLGVRKSGSTILNEMINALAKTHAYGVCDFHRMFEVGLVSKDWRFDPALASLLRGGNVYGGFRDFPAALDSSPQFAASPKVLLVRDPRDALVSLYFSDAYSHFIPPAGAARDLMLAQRRQAQNSSLESYVLDRAQGMAHTLMGYVRLLSDPLLKLYRYEDVIFEKRRLLENISTHFGWPVDSSGIELILEWADVVPAKEQPKEFIRRVHPGDHKEKLSENAIATLNKILAKVLKIYRYAS